MTQIMMTQTTIRRGAGNSALGATDDEPKHINTKRGRAQVEVEGEPIVLCEQSVLPVSPGRKAYLMDWPPAG